VLGALEGWICLNTLIKHGDYAEVFSIAVSVMAIVLLVDYFSDRVKELLTSLMLNYEWVVYANLVTVLMYPNTGIVQDVEYYNLPVYFFDVDNRFMYLCIPSVCVSLLYLRMQLAQNRKIDGVIRSAYLILASYACVFLQKPVTALVALAVLALVIFIALIPGVRHCVIFPVALFCGIIADLVLSVFQLAEKTAISDFFTNVLGKAPTLSGRTPLWNYFFEQIQGHFWTGIGNPHGGYYLVDRYYDHIHNQYFDLLALGGSVALLLFLTAIIFAGVKLTRHRKTWSARIMTAVFSGFFIMCIPEVCRLGSIFLIFPLAYHAEKLEAACKPAVPPHPESEPISDEEIP